MLRWIFSQTGSGERLGAAANTSECFAPHAAEEISPSAMAQGKEASLLEG
jgi:hypothetical protein